MNTRIVITGIGVVSSIGIGKNAYWTAIKKGQSGINKITLFDTSSYKVNLGGEVSQFDPTQFFSKKELIDLDRATSLLLASSKLALEDAKLFITENNTNDIGVVIGTTFGSLHSLSEFDKESLIKGPKLVNPSRFPNTVANLPASRVSIYYKIRGLNATLSTGMCAGLDAIDYAIKAIQFHGKKVILAGVVEEMCEQTFFGFYRLKMLSGFDNGALPICCPFDLKRNGIVFGEGSGILVLEPEELAKKRGAFIYGEILSSSSNFDPYRLHRYNPKATGMIEVMQLALNKAGLSLNEIDCIYANANSTQEADFFEAVAVREVFGAHADKISVTSIKSMLGETYSAAGGLACIASVGSLHSGFIPPIINTFNPDPRIDLKLILDRAVETEVNTIMINTFSPNGSNSSLIIKKYNESK